MVQADGYYTNLSSTQSVRPTAFQVTQRAHSGTYLQTPGGVLLCRLTPGMVHFWDKKSKSEVSISFDQLESIAANID